MAQLLAARKKRRRPPKAAQVLPVMHPSGTLGAWGASLGLHGLIVLLIALFAGGPSPVEETSQPIELVDFVTDAPQGDRKEAAADRAAPQPAPNVPQDAQEQRAEQNDAIESPQRAEAAAAPALKPRIPKLDVDALLAQRELDEREREAKRIGELQAAEPVLEPEHGSDRRASLRQVGGVVDNGSGLTGDLGQRRILEKVQPSYPEAARRTGLEGDVKLRVWVSAEGQVGRVEIVKFSGTPEMDKRAIDSLKRWRFAPLPEGASAMTQWGEITMQFRLD